MEKHLQNGFTLIELMVTLSVAAILLGVGIPSFSSAMQNSRISANYNALAQALYIARSEAVKGSETITVCARGAGDAHSCDDDWNKGILVFVDNSPVNAGSDLAQFGAEDVVLYSQSELKKGTNVTAYLSTDRTITTKAKTHMLRYDSTGKSNWANGYFLLCDIDRGTEYSKALNVVVTGNIRRGRTSDSSSRTPIEVFGNEILCPAS